MSVNPRQRHSLRTVGAERKTMTTKVSSYTHTWPPVEKHHSKRQLFATQTPPCLVIKENVESTL